MSEPEPRPGRRRGASPQRRIEATIKAMKKAGIAVDRVELDGNRIIIVTANGEKRELNEWDRALG